MKTMKKNELLSKREFLKLAWNGILASYGLYAFGAFFRFLSYQPQSKPKSKIELGAKSNYPPGSTTVLSEYKIILTNDTNGYSAIDTTCTHLGCQVGMQENELLCPCHGSKFDLKGTPTHGPANRELRKWTVEETQDGNLILSKI